MIKLYLTLASLLLGTGLMAQSNVPINNPSFEEGIAERGKRNTQIPGWLDCGAAKETAPDVHSELSDFFGVNHSAAHGFNFLMLVARDNDTQEMIGAPLKRSLLKDSAYVLSVQLARPATCISRSKKYEINMEYNHGVILRIFGGTKACDPYQLLAESPVINDPDWNEHQFLLLPYKDYDLLFIQAYYDSKAKEPYNGSILLDDIKIVNKGRQHQAMHSMIASGKQYEWPSALKIERTIAELVPEGLERFPGNIDEMGHFQETYSSLVYLYAMMKMEHHFTHEGTLLSFIKNNAPEDLISTIEGLRHIHAYQSAETMENMFHYYQLLESSSINKDDALYQMKKLEKEFTKLIRDDEIIEKRIRHVITYRSKILKRIRLALIDILGGREVLNFVKKG